jgi:hypothetical protein
VSVLQVPHVFFVHVFLYTFMYTVHVFFLQLAFRRPGNQFKNSGSRVGQWPQPSAILCTSCPFYGRRTQTFFLSASPSSLAAAAAAAARLNWSAAAEGAVVIVKHTRFRVAAKATKGKRRRGINFFALRNEMLLRAQAGKVFTITQHIGAINMLTRARGGGGGGGGGRGRIKRGGRQKEERRKEGNRRSQKRTRL